MILHHAILHILDTASGKLTLSQQELSLERLEVVDYLTTLMKKIEKSETRRGVLDPSSDLSAYLQTEAISFIDKSQQLSEKLFSILAKAEDRCGADYIFCSGLLDNGQSFFALLRLDYSSRFTHAVTPLEEDVQIDIVSNHRLLPSPTTLPSEAFVVNVDNLAFQLLEKKATIEGKKDYYFSTQFLEIEVPATAKEQLKSVQQTVKKLSEAYDEDTYQVLSTLQQALYHQVEQQDIIDTHQLVEAVFEHNPAAQAAAKQAITHENFPQTVHVAHAQQYEKKYSLQKFKLANGIELTIPMDIYQDKDMVEFIHQPDGSITVLLKNIENITNTFRL